MWKYGNNSELSINFYNIIFLLKARTVGSLVGRLEYNPKDKVMSDLIKDISLLMLHQKIEFVGGIFTINYKAFVAVKHNFRFL